mmetsp:Transcript_6053/g.14757  ORF Transcript_6053/g.14757 Transcript_6053/m.14757 type:complete len:398 (+) Transcript_6053:511-1704(+)
MAKAHKESKAPIVLAREEEEKTTLKAQVCLAVRLPCVAATRGCEGWQARCYLADARLELAQPVSASLLLALARLASPPADPPHLASVSPPPLQLEVKHEVAENMANLTLIQKAARAAQMGQSKADAVRSAKEAERAATLEASERRVAEAAARKTSVDAAVAAKAAQMGTSKAAAVKESMEAERAASKAALDRKMAEAAARKEEVEAATVAKMAAMTSSKAAEVRASEAAAAAEKQANSEKRVAEAAARSEALKVAKAERAMQMSSKANPSFREQEKKAEEEAAAKIAQKMANAEARRQSAEAEKVARMQVLSSPGPKGKRPRPAEAVAAVEAEVEAEAEGTTMMAGAAVEGSTEAEVAVAMPTTLPALMVSVVSYVFTLLLQLFKSVAGGDANPKQD